MKINVVGTSGSGKSTLARQLAERLDVPYIEMDRLYWRPEWQGTPDDAFLARLEQTLAEAGGGWVLDGNYSRTQAIKWREVDYILWLDYGFCRTLWQGVRRACRRAASKSELWPGTGNRESFRRSFFSRESIVLWTIRTYSKNRRKYLAEMARTDAGRRFKRLRSPRQAADCLRTLPQVHSSRR
ncbi:adenylate kinase [Serratia marcescens]|uniref:AAA family ATPase n=1 Tax=Serratia marcescens TaxID=615 RepID=UPI00093B1A98|nr:shikimate kinase [Serratia marcescens]OKP32725.1 adenylate kinase [Serratia marcescens]